MDIVTINAIILPWFAVFLVPNALRDQKSGNYLGYRNKNVYLLFSTLLIIESILVLSEFGFGALSVARIFSTTLLPFVLALLWLVLTQKKMYGNKFRMTTKKGS